MLCTLTWWVIVFAKFLHPKIHLLGIAITQLSLARNMICTCRVSHSLHAKYLILPQGCDAHKHTAHHSPSAPKRSPLISSPHPSSELTVKRWVLSKQPQPEKIPLSSLSRGRNCRSVDLGLSSPPPVDWLRIFQKWITQQGIQCLLLSFDTEGEVLKRPSFTHRIITHPF